MLTEISKELLEEYELRTKEKQINPLTLEGRRSPLASPSYQLKLLNELTFSEERYNGHFKVALKESGWEELKPEKIEIFQINLGKLCNMACKHCHVDAGPTRTKENMDRETVDACLKALDQTEAHTVDLTGGAPELNPHFRYLVDECIKRGKHVIDRCNLTVLLLKRNKDLAQFLADRGVEVVCSLPHYRKRNTDAQRGKGAYEKSIEALKLLNSVGYGKDDPNKILTLMVNPSGSFLAGNQCSMQREWKTTLKKLHDISFDRLISLNNMPISRFLEWLEKTDNLQSYMEVLLDAYNPTTVHGLMCRNTLSISWDGKIYDCDFNQMLELETVCNDGMSLSVQNFDVHKLENREIVTKRHCFGCTAGSGSSCAGALDE